VVAFSLASCCGWFLWRKCWRGKRKRRQDSTLSEISSADSSSEEQASEKESRRRQKKKAKKMLKFKKKARETADDEDDLRAQKSGDIQAGGPGPVIHTNCLYTAEELSRSSALHPLSSYASLQTSQSPTFSWRDYPGRADIMPVHLDNIANNGSPYFQSPLFTSPTMVPHYNHRNQDAGSPTLPIMMPQGHQDARSNASPGLMYLTPQQPSTFNKSENQDSKTSNQKLRMQRPRSATSDGPSYFNSGSSRPLNPPQTMEGSRDRQDLRLQPQSPRHN
jgi:hypothetical protein